LPDQDEALAAAPKAVDGRFGRAADPGGSGMTGMTELIRFDAATLAAKIAAKEVSSIPRSPRRTSTKSPPPTTGITLLARAADEGARRGGPGRCSGGGRRAAVVPAGRGSAGAQGRVHRHRHADYVRVEDLEGWARAVRRHGHRAAARGGHPDPWQTNMDEFAMGSSTENSAYGPTRNPWNVDRVPGGSGGGSAAALAAFQAPLADGVRHRGSIRQPAALTATVGVKPTTARCRGTG